MESRFGTGPIRMIGAALGFVLILSLSALACNLTSQDSEPTAVSGLQQPMQTRIISPQPNASFEVNEPITVQTTVNDPDGTGVTRVELIANNIAVDQKPSQNPQGDKELTVNLTWDSPSIPGQYTLVVRPYRGQVQGTPATVRIQVVEDNLAVATQTSSSGGTSGGSGTSPTAFAPTYDPRCRARIDVNRLNFRSSPTTETDENLIGYYLVGDEAPVLGRLADNSWYRTRAITNPSITGWIYGPFTTLLGNCSSVPIINPPSTQVPTQTPTLEPSVEPLPDIVALSPSGLSNLQAGFDGTATATYTFTVQNTGQVATGPFEVLISLSDGTQVSESIPGLQPGQALTFPDEGLRVTFQSPGQHRIFYEADVNLQVEETNEQNNLAFLDVNVQSQ